MLKQRLVSPSTTNPANSELAQFDEVRAALVSIALDMKVGFRLAPVAQSDDSRYHVAHIKIDHLGHIWVIHQDGEARWYCSDEVRPAISERSLCYLPGLGTTELNIDDTYGGNLPPRGVKLHGEPKLQRSR